MFQCSKCQKELNYGERINYNNQYTCPKCAYESAPENSPVRVQLEMNYKDFLKEGA